MMSRNGPFLMPNSDPLFSKAIYDSSFKYASVGPAVWTG